MKAKKKKCFTRKWWWEKVNKANLVWKYTKITSSNEFYWKSSTLKDPFGYVLVLMCYSCIITVFSPQFFNVWVCRLLTWYDEIRANEKEMCSQQHSFVKTHKTTLSTPEFALCDYIAIKASGTVRSFILSSYQLQWDVPLMTSIFSLQSLWREQKLFQRYHKIDVGEN